MAIDFVINDSNHSGVHKVDLFHSILMAWRSCPVSFVRRRDLLLAYLLVTTHDAYEGYLVFNDFMAEESQGLLFDLMIVSFNYIWFSNFSNVCIFSVTVNEENCFQR